MSSQKILYIVIAFIVMFIACIFIWRAGNSIEPTPGNTKTFTETAVEVVAEQVVDSENQEDTTEENIEIVDLPSVNERLGTAVATRVQNDTYVHTVTAEVSDPLDGKFYEGWLVVKGANPRDFFSTGAMEKNEDGKWTLRYESDREDLDKYTFVVITEETLADGLDNNPETHIFEGLFN